MRAGSAGSLTALYAHGVLVTPYAVRVAIEKALDEGWDPDANGHRHVEVPVELDDRRVDVPVPPGLERRECELLDAVAADPAALAVYADFLIERGDPQGPLLDGTDRAALDALLGPVSEVVERCGWERGLLVRAALARRQTGVVDLAIGHRMWRTVRELDATDGMLSNADRVRLLAQPMLRDLRRLTISTKLASLLASEGTGFPRVTHLAVPFGPPIDPDDLLALAGEMRALELLMVGNPRNVALLAAGLPDVTVVQRSTTPIDARGASQCLVWSPYWSGFATPGPTLTVSRGRLEVAWQGLYHPYRQEMVLDLIANRLPVDLPIDYDPSAIAPDLARKLDALRR